MKIRKAGKTDASAMSKIVGRNYSRKYEIRAKAEIDASFWNKAGKPRYFLAEEDGKIFGLAGYIQSWMDYDVFEIFWVSVAPDHQRNGIGTMLANKVIHSISKNREAKFILLTTKKPRFWRKFGFMPLMRIGKENYLMKLEIKNRENRAF